MTPRADDISFKEHFEELLAAIQKLQDERWKSHDGVHVMGQLAIDASVKALDARLEIMNQFRAQISEERGEFVKVDVYGSERKALEAKFEAKLDAGDKRIGILENNQSNQAGRTAAYVTVTGVVFALIEIFLHFWK